METTNDLGVSNIDNIVFWLNLFMPAGGMENYQEKIV
jgi:hypothetical protein